MPQEFRDALTIARSLLDRLEERVVEGREEPQAVVVTLKSVIGLLGSHGRPKRASKKPLRGVGYDFDEAFIVASIPKYGSLEKSVRAYFPTRDEKVIERYVKRIRRHMKDIEKASASAEDI